MCTKDLKLLSLNWLVWVLEVRTDQRKLMFFVRGGKPGNQTTILQQLAISKLTWTAPSSKQYRISYVAICAAQKIRLALRICAGYQFRQQLYFRFAVLDFKCMTGCAPEYLTSTLVRRTAVSTRANTTLPHYQRSKDFSKQSDLSVE